MVGKVFPVLSMNENSGIYVHAGVGYLQHKLRIESNDQVIPSLELDYKKGYDRFTSGINFHQFVGYAFLANQGIVNFYGGFYAQQGLTYNRREIFFDRPDRRSSQRTTFGCTNRIQSRLVYTGLPTQTERLLLRLMRLLYAIGMGGLYCLMWCASLFNAKARKWITWP